MKIHLLQHVSFEGPGCIADWAERSGHTLRFTRFFEHGWALPEHDAYEMLVVMGGPMGVHDTAQYPWLEEEKAFVRSAITQGKQVLGICLGAQMIAHALGAEVARNAQVEIGWFPIVWHDQVRGHPLLYGLGSTQTVFHWHGDRFELPAGATLVAKSEACDHQAFICGTQVLALQFHLEMTETGVEALLNNGAETLRHPGRYVQKPEAIRSRYSLLPSLNAMMFRLLDSWTATAEPARMKKSR